MRFIKFRTFEKAQKWVDEHPLEHVKYIAHYEVDPR